VLSRVGKSLAGLAASLAIGAGVAVAAMVAGLGALTVQAFGTIDALAKTADIVNATTEGLVAMRLAADLSGVGAEQLDGALGKMSKNIGDFVNGTGEAKRSLEQLGLTQDDLLGKKADEQYEIIADRIANMSDANQQAAAAQAIFGKQGQKMLPMLRQGSEGMRAARAEAERLGISLTRVDAAKIEAANDAITTTKKAMQGIGQQLAIQFAPFVAAVANGITTLAVKVRPWIVGFVEASINAFKRLVAFVAPLVITWVGVVRAQIGFLVDIFMGLWDGVKWVLNALGINLDGFSESMTSWRDAIQEVLLRMEFAFLNWREFLQLAVDRVILGVVTFANQVQHFFTVVIPTYLKWLRENWFNILITIGANTLSFFENLAGNVVNVLKNLPALMSGQVNFADLWKPLTTGFVNVIEELPQIAERQMGPLEAMLANKVEAQQRDLSDKYEKFAADRRRQVEADAAKFAAAFDFTGGAPKPPPGGGDDDETKRARAAGGGGNEGTGLLRLTSTFLGLRERMLAGEDPQRIVAKNSQTQINLLGKSIEATNKVAEAIRRGMGGGIPLFGGNA